MKTSVEVSYKNRDTNATENEKRRIDFQVVSRVWLKLCGYRKRASWMWLRKPNIDGKSSIRLPLPSRPTWRMVTKVYDTQMTTTGRRFTSLSPGPISNIASRLAPTTSTEVVLPFSINVQIILMETARSRHMTELPIRMASPVPGAPKVQAAGSPFGILQGCGMTSFVTC